MELKTAIHLIANGIPEVTGKQVWADLGAGRGLFSRALASRLPAGSTTHAVDKDARSLDAIVLPGNGIILRKIAADFGTLEFPTEKFDGILMANSLHFIAARGALLERLKGFLRASGRMIVVEYDTNSSNRWIPYPVSYQSLQELARPAFTSIQKMGDTGSVFGSGRIYSALLTV